MSKIESLPDIHWSAQAALMDLYDSADQIDQMLIIYTDKDGNQRCQSSGLTHQEALWLLQTEINRTMG